MRYPAGHKRASRQRIVNAAATLFRRQGIAATGLDAVMAAAGLTAGGFYAHFRSKDSLVTAAVDAAGELAVERWFTPLDALSGRAWTRAFVGRYLSPEHRDDPRSGCFVPSLAADVARAGPAARRRFEQRLRGFFDAVAERSLATSPRERERVIGAVALSVGGVLLSRVVVDRELSGEILGACRASAEALLTASPPRPKGRKTSQPKAPGHEARP